MVEMGKECGFSSNIGMLRLFTSRKTELQPIKSPNSLLYPRVDEEQRTHSEDEIGTETSPVHRLIDEFQLIDHHTGPKKRLKAVCHAFDWVI